MRRSVVNDGVLLALLAVTSILASGCVETSCLEEGTLVETPDGSRAIETLRVGDRVVSVDPASGARVGTRVSRVEHAWAWCHKLRLDDRHVWLTAEHPLYSPEVGAFVPAEQWLSGDLRRTLGHDGQLVATNPGAWFERRPCRVVDLTVSSAPHTFVANGIVVHNKQPPPLDGDCFFGCAENEVCGDNEVCEPCACDCDTGPPVCVVISPTCSACLDRPDPNDSIDGLDECLNDEDCGAGEACVVVDGYDYRCLAKVGESGTGGSGGEGGSSGAGGAGGAGGNLP